VAFKMNDTLNTNESVAVNPMVNRETFRTSMTNQSLSSTGASDRDSNTALPFAAPKKLTPSEREFLNSHPGYERPALHDLTKSDFYKQEGWMEKFCEALFKIKARETTIKAELYYGVIHFISCLYCLAVVPQQLGSAGYDGTKTVVAVALLCGVGSIFCGLFSNLPFVLAPPTVVTIFQSVYMQQYDIGPQVGNIGVMLSGVCLMLFGWRPIGELAKRLIPLPIQVGTVVGIGMLTTLAGSTEIDFVIRGKYKILRMGHITDAVFISFVGVFIICVAMRYHIKGSFCICVLFCSVSYWLYNLSFPDEIFAWPSVTTANFQEFQNQYIPLLTIDLLFLYVLYLNGLMTSLSNLAVLTREDGATPRGRWIFILSGFFTVCGGMLNVCPILVSPESSAAIKEGARTGLSTVVAGVLFLFAAFFAPLFEKVPAAGTSPVLIVIGLILFQNVNRIEWRNVTDAAPAFLILFYVPFTYSIIQG
jgi:adenine/guanine/hypoxanthine permease